MAYARALMTTQRDNKAGRDIVAGDQNIDQSLRLSLDSSGSPQMRRLIEALKSEGEEARTTQSYLDDLVRWHEVIDREFIGLEEKLRNGDREDSFGFARESKDLYTRKLMKHSFSESAQSINALLLSRVWSIFNAQVHPQIAAGCTRLQADIMIRTLIIDPLHIFLGDNPLNLLEGDVYGMIYFLTGNCHIRWD